MKICALMGSPRKQGNTASLLEEFLSQWRELGQEGELIWLYERDIRPCLGCMACQDRFDGLGCVQKDGLEGVFASMAQADALLFATPIYAWYCTTPMKALLDRVVYAGTKNYGRKKGPSLLRGKGLASLVTCGYPEEKGADLWQAGLQRWCRHSGLSWWGMLCARDKGPGAPFLTQDKLAAARDFARALYRQAGGEEV